MNMLDIENVIKKMTVKEFRNFIYENHLKQIVLLKKSYYSLIQLEKKILLLS